MTDPTPRSVDLDTLVHRLTRLRDDVAFPPTPDLATSVRAVLDRRPTSPIATVPRHRWGSSGRRFSAAVATAILLLAVATLAAPPTRAVVAGWLDRIDLPGVRIEFVEDGDDAAETPSAVGATLLLGERVSLTDAAASVPFALQVPTGDALGAPDEVYLRQVEGGTLVSLLYLPRPDLPEIGTTGVGALLMQFRSTQEVEWIVKGVRTEEAVVSVRIGTRYGYWIRDGRLYLAQDPTGDLPVSTGASRPSGNVLLWQEGGVTYRLETALAQAPAVALAESLAPLPPTPAAADRSR